MEPAGQGHANQRDHRAQLPKLDSKMLPPIPTPNAARWLDRPSEILGFHRFSENLASWLSMISPQFGAGMCEIGIRVTPVLQQHMSDEQAERSTRLYHILKQLFHDSPRISVLIRCFEVEFGPGNSNGFELYRRLRMEYCLKTRAEGLHFRHKMLEFRVPKDCNLRDVTRLLDGFPIVSLMHTQPGNQVHSVSVSQCRLGSRRRAVNNLLHKNKRYWNSISMNS